MASRACASAEEVTVQVLMTTNSALCGEAEIAQPRLSSWRSIAAPSAWVARHPNCPMEKVDIAVRTARKKSNIESAENTEDVERRQIQSGRIATQKRRLVPQETAGGKGRGPRWGGGL